MCTYMYIWCSEQEDSICVDSIAQRNKIQYIRLWLYRKYLLVGNFKYCQTNYLSPGVAKLRLTARF